MSSSVLTFCLLFSCVLLHVFSLPVHENGDSKESILDLKYKKTKTMVKGQAVQRAPSVVLFTQGVCDEEIRSSRIYTENFVLENDGKSQVYAVLNIQVSGSPNITCIEIVSRSNDKTRPYIDKGGVGHPFVDVGVVTEYGKGFDFSVNLFGSYFSNV